MTFDIIRCLRSNNIYNIVSDPFQQLRFTDVRFLIDQNQSKFTAVESVASFEAGRPPQAPPFSTTAFLLDDNKDKVL